MESRIPNETDSIECNHQQIGNGSLLCRAARQTGNKTTNEVNPTICFNCDAGRIYREVGCDAAIPKIKIWPLTHGESQVSIDNLFCKIRKRDTTLEYCRSCTLVTAETTRELVTTTRGLFTSHGFYSSYKSLESARLAIRDGEFEHAITQSIACLESTMRIILEKLGQPLPKKRQVTDLWKTTRSVLEFDNLSSSESIPPLMNSLTGTVSHLGGLRNALGDAHGKGIVVPAVSESIAELAINTSATLSTMIIRQYVQIKVGNDE